MRVSTKTIHFPSAGLDRSLSYRSGTVPSENRIYATLSAVNVRGTDVFSGRFRGGSRPGLKLIPAPVDIDERYEKPTAFYRGRKIYANGNFWFASRAGNISDFYESGDGDDPTRPAMGKVGFASVKDAEPITAIFCASSSVIFIATKRSVWKCEGDVTTGSFEQISRNAGVISKDAWAYDGSVFYFVSSNGIYAIVPGQGVINVSDNLPEEISGMLEAFVAYDPEHHALHIFSDQGDWYYEIKAKAWWIQSYYSLHRPTNVATVFVGGKRKIALLGHDECWRVFDDGTEEDEKEETGETYAFTSFVAIGPIRTSAREDLDGMLDKISTTLALQSYDVKCEIYAGRTAEDAVKLMNDGVCVREITLTGGRKSFPMLRVRGAWVILVLSAKKPWAFESMTAVTKALGGLR